MSELLHNFLKNREKLDSALRNGLLLTNSYSDRVGLINQGATCYLNSLLQCLFYNLSFRVLILQAKPDSAILIALQELFAQLQLSSSSAVNTKDLVTAFGWARGQVFEQHDVHELFSLLLDALGNCSTALSTQLPDLFQGSISGSSHQFNFIYLLLLDSYINIRIISKLSLSDSIVIEQLLNFS